MRGPPIFVLFLLLSCCLTQNASLVCYVSCGQGGCQTNSSLACTKCDLGTMLVNDKCVIQGFQSEPFRFLFPVNDSFLDTSFSKQKSKKNQVVCKSQFNTNTNSSTTLAFYNVSKTNNQIYTYRFPRVQVKTEHKFVNFRFNAILFNKRANSTIKILIIDDLGKRVFNNFIRENDGGLICNENQPQTKTNSFFISIPLSTSSKDFLIQITSAQQGDLLGISDFNIFSGNCQQGCASCNGPTQSQCLSCNNLLVFDENDKRCKSCPSRFYKIGQQCRPCPFFCQTCQLDPLNAFAICTKCQENITQRLNITDSLNCRTLYYQNQSLTHLSFTYAENWESNEFKQNSTSKCGIYSMVGGLQKGLGGSTLYKTFTNLPVHRQIYLKFSLFLIDQQPGSQFRFQIRVDGKNALNDSISIDTALIKINQCGDERNQYIKTIFIKNYSHSSLEAKVQILGYSNFFGIRDFVFGVYNLTKVLGCQELDKNNQCIRCKNGYQINDIKPCTKCPDGYYNQTDGGQCLICPIQCNTCAFTGKITQCLTCHQPLQFSPKYGTCYDKKHTIYSLELSQSFGIFENNGWTMKPNLQSGGIASCGKEKILGSTQIRYRTLQMSKSFKELPQHSKVTIYFFIYQIDDFDIGIAGNSSNTINIQIGKFSFPYIAKKRGFNKCGNSTYDLVSKNVFTIDHTESQLTIKIQGSRIKFGISSLAILLHNCQQCKNSVINYKVQALPIYSADSNEIVQTVNGVVSKISFDNQIKVSKNLNRIFLLQLVKENFQLSQSTGERSPFEIKKAEIRANREIIYYQTLNKDYKNQNLTVVLLQPEAIRGIGSNNRFKLMNLNQQQTEFSRYDNIDSLTKQGTEKKANVRNLMNFFRGVSTLSLFIGLISFFFFLSDIFDDLFLSCQIVFVHLFIQFAWLPASMQLPIGAMNLVQFMAWLPIQARYGLQNAIIPSNHYINSPMVFQQYWRDVTFVRCIYHVIIFLAVMGIFYLLLSLIMRIYEPKLNQAQQLEFSKFSYAFSYYKKSHKKWFVFIDKIVRFSFFTVIWASSLQFTSFKNEPASFMVWNSILCIVFFIGYTIYPAITYLFYIKKERDFTSIKTFKSKFDGLRLESSKMYYFFIKYYKNFLIVFLISQLYAQNPLATLIPLILIHIADFAIIFKIKPYLEESDEHDKIVSKFTKSYWISYHYMQLIQNALFVILEIIMIIMHGIKLIASKDEYLASGYAFCAFVVILLIMGILRVVWNIVRQVQIWVADIETKEQEIQTEAEANPILFLQYYRAQNEKNLNEIQNFRQGKRRISIEGNLN